MCRVKTDLLGEHRIEFVPVKPKGEDMDMRYIDPDDGECLFCHGDGDCPRCHGHGYVGQKICPTCQGEEVCPNCHGEGYFELPERRNFSPRIQGSLSGQFTGLPHHIMHELAQPGSGNYRGHCVAALMQSGVGPIATNRIQNQMPEHVSYEQYVEFVGIVTSGRNDLFIAEHVNRLFPDWMSQFFSKIFQWFLK